MPIRTNRGRSAAYRQLFTWPMRSRRRLAVTLFVVAAAAVTFGVATSLTEGSSGAPAALTPSVAATDTPAPASTSSAPSVSRPLTAASPASKPALEAFKTGVNWTRAWLKHPIGTLNPQWVVGLAPFTTDELLGQLRSVEPANVPSTFISSAPKLREVQASSVKLEIATNGAMLRLTVISTPAGWRVSAYDKGD